MNKTKELVTVCSNINDFIPAGINDSDFTRSLFLIRLQIALEEIKERLQNATCADELDRTKEELSVSEQFYNSYLSTFN